MRYASKCKGFLSTVTLIGAALFSATASATVTALPGSYDPTTKVVTIGVHIAGYARPGYIPLGTVVFTESSSTLGTGSQANCDLRSTSCDWLLQLPGDYALGPHTITATYTIEQPGGPYPPVILTFTVAALNPPGWLPAVLSLLLD